jgi:ABC-type transport system involved in multi-copper enzyme maturation permease subunit
MRMVAWREVRAASRKRMTYWRRVIAGAAGALLILTLGGSAPRTMFLISVAVAFALCLVEGVRLASTSIVDERAEGTLPLLLLTKLSGKELLFGKLFALGFFSLQTLLAISPVLAISLILGGVSFWELARTILALAHALLIALSCGLVFSCRSRNAQRAIISTFSFLFIYAIAFSFDWGISSLGRVASFIYASLNPLTPIWTIPDLSYTTMKVEYWFSIVGSAICALRILSKASRKLSINYAADEAAFTEPQPEDQWAVQHTMTVRAGDERVEWFSGNPIEWLALRNLYSRSRLRRTIASGGVLILGLALLAIQFQGLLWVVALSVVFGFLFAVGSAHTFARARQSGEIELWLTTPLTIEEIVKGHTSAIRKTFFCPGIVLIVAWGMIFYLVIIKQTLAGVMNLKITGPFASIGKEWMLFYILVSLMLSLASLMFALPYVAMWIALKTKSPGQAAARTFLLMIVFPWFIFFVPKALLFVPAAFLAKRSVRDALKNFATLRQQSGA